MPSAVQIQKNSYAFDFCAANSLPTKIRFGTSSWNYQGWSGLVYHKAYRTKKAFTEGSLSEYCDFPWFRSVGVDAFFYRPPTEKTLFSWAKLVPETFQWVEKVWERLTIAQYARHARYGEHKGQLNPDFLNAELFYERVLKAHENPAIRAHTGAFVFQFQSPPESFLGPEKAFLTRLDRFLSELPSCFNYAVEIRNAELLGRDYFELLNKYRVSHCFNHWTSMPPLVEQMRLSAEVGGLAASFYIARALTPLGVSYEDAVKRFSPYNQIQMPNEELRRDLVRLVKRAIETDKSAFVIVNNRAEGCAPITIDCVGRAVMAGSG